MSLKEWFGKGPKGDWVDIGAPKKDGKYQACGRSSASKSKRAYPKCVPRSKAKSMTAAEKKSAVARKRAKTQGAMNQIIYTVVAIGSLSSGALIHFLDWNWVNIGAVPFLLVAAAVTFWFATSQRDMASG